MKNQNKTCFDLLIWVIFIEITSNVIKHKNTFVAKHSTYRKSIYGWKCENKDIQGYLSWKTTHEFCLGVNMKVSK